MKIDWKLWMSPDGKDTQVRTSTELPPDEGWVCLSSIKNKTVDEAREVARRMLGR